MQLFINFSILCEIQRKVFLFEMDLSFYPFFSFSFSKFETAFSTKSQKVIIGVYILA